MSTIPVFRWRMVCCGVEVPSPVDFPAPLDRPLAVEHVTVVPMDRERRLENHTVVVDGGTIRTVAPSPEVDTAGMQVLDGTGRFLLPGLADMHVHFWDPGEASMFLANGVTTVRNMWGHPFHLAWQGKVQRGELPGPRVVTTSPIIDGPGNEGKTIWPGSTLLAKPEDAVALVREYTDRGYRQIKAYSWLTLDTLTALGSAAAECSVRMVGHCPDGISYEQAIEAGMSCFEHLTGVAHGRLKGGRELPPGRIGNPEVLRTIARYLDLESTRRLAARMARQEIWNCPTAVVWQGTSLPESEAMSRPWLRYEPQTLINSWNPANDFRFRDAPYTRDEYVAAARERNEMLLQVIGILHQEGAPLLLGTDTPNPFTFQGFSLHDELDNLIRAGLTPYEALACGTTEAARFLGEDDWGTIAPGKRADLLLVDGDPLREIATLRRPAAVIVNRYLLQRADLDRLLESREGSVREARPSGPLELPPARGPGSTEREGRWIARMAGAEVAWLTFRHVRLPDGDLRVEERYASWDEAFARHACALRLAPGLTVRAGELTAHFFVGDEHISIDSASETDLTVRHRDVDGFETTTTLHERQLIPDITLLRSAMPAILTARDGAAGMAEVRALSIDGGRACVVPVTLTPMDPGGVEWEVKLERSGTTTVQTYRLNAHGELESVREMTWMGPWEMSP